MKFIRVASDLHLEGFVGRTPEQLAQWFLTPDDRDAESVLVLAGDISSQPDQLVEFIAHVRPRFQEVLYVPGNHEYYRQHYQDLNAALNVALKDHAYVAAGTVDAVTIDGVRFVLGTLWGDGGPTLADQAQVGFYLNDFRLIKFEDRRFTTGDMIEIAKEQRAKIRTILEQKFDGPTVVVTHHMPSRRLVSGRFWPKDGSDGANGGFVNDCENIIATLEPNLWIHGHTHDQIDTELWNTKIVCHPCGYRGEWGSEFNEVMEIVREPNTPASVRSAPMFIEVSEL